MRLSTGWSDRVKQVIFRQPFPSSLFYFVRSFGLSLLIIFLVTIDPAMGENKEDVWGRNQVTGQTSSCDYEAQLRRVGRRQR